MTVYDYFERAYRRSLDPVAGEPVCDEHGNCAMFSVDVMAGRIAAVRYRCTVCITLVGLCQHLSELVTGLDAGAILEMQPDTLLGLHPEVPESKRPAALLALEALQSAVGGARQ
ncbi:MAG TPA: hypothetical protein VFL57_20935 [Bryobacteraceae bacterium]|nr:hypothetical protein [Bryobacteraceae bacterium]